MVCAELFEQFREPAIVAVSGNEAETAVDFETVRVDNTQFVVCEFVQNGLNGDKGEGSRIVQVAFDAFAAPSCISMFMDCSSRPQRARASVRMSSVPEPFSRMTRGRRPSVAMSTSSSRKAEFDAEVTSTSSSCMKGS